MTNGDDPSAPDPAHVAEVERVCDRYEDALRAGGHPLIEDELSAVSARGRDLLLRELIALDLAYRRRLGESPAAAEYLARFPGNDWAVRAAFESPGPATLVGDETALRPPRASGPGGPTVAVPRGQGQDRDAADGTVVRYFGDYEIRGVLGRGGMGVVYRALQVSLHRPVALKMIRGSVTASDEERRRFHNEAEIAAGLDHPNIVPVHEVGEHEGQPYLTMRLIDGEGLDRRLPAFANAPRAAADLLRLTAVAVHHAHRRGVLHRDLKPANILVDTAGVPYVTDFGLARTAEGAGDLTHTGAVIGTPAYMAPEQAGGRRGAATVATDVHGLGTVLYALLTGRAPFTADSVAAMLERVREAAPEPPSRLNGSVPRDLEVVCLKCLEKDPARRYASAQDVADDLGRFLAGEPIHARPVGRLARLGMWARRRPAVAALAAALVLAVTAGVAGMAWQWRVAVVERDRSDAVRDFLLKDLLAEAAPELNERARNITLLDVIDRASARVDGAFVGRPESEGAVRLMLGQVYLKLGEYRKAEPHLQRARELFAKVGGENSTDALNAANDLAVGLFKQGRLDGAEAAYRRVLEGYRRALGDGSPRTLVTMSNLGDVLRSAHRLDEAETLLRAASTGLNRRLGPTAPESLRAAVNLAIVAHTRRRLDEAESLYRRAIDAYKNAGKARSPDYLSMLNNFAILLQERTDLAGAEGVFREVVAVRNEVQGPEHPETLMSMNNLADLLATTKNPSEAESVWRKVLAALERLPDRGARSEVSALARANLADLLAGQGNRAGAEPLYLASLETATALWGRDNPVTRTIQAHLDALRSAPSAPAK